MVITKNAKASTLQEWPGRVLEAVCKLQAVVAEDGVGPLKSVNYFTPRPYVDVWNRGSRDTGLVYTTSDGQVGQMLL